MKLKSLINARKIIASQAKEKMPAQIAYKFVKFLKSTNDDETFFNEKFREIINEYAQKDEQNNLVYGANGGISLNPERSEECKKEINELDNMEIDLPLKFSIDELAVLKLSMSEVFDLDDIITEG